jgi:hypothetical protein
MAAHKSRTHAWVAVYGRKPLVIVGVVCALASGFGLIAAFGDLYGENPVSWSMVLGPMVVSVFPTLELTWHRDRDLSMASLKRRWLVLPLLGALGTVLAMGLAMYAVNADAAALAGTCGLRGFPRTV